MQFKFHMFSKHFEIFKMRYLFKSAMFLLILKVLKYVGRTLAHPSLPCIHSIMYKNKNLSKRKKIVYKVLHVLIISTTDKCLQTIMITLCKLKTGVPNQQLFNNSWQQLKKDKVISMLGCRDCQLMSNPHKLKYTILTIDSLFMIMQRVQCSTCVIAYVISNEGSPVQISQCF